MHIFRVKSRAPSARARAREYRLPRETFPADNVIRPPQRRTAITNDMKTSATSGRKYSEIVALRRNSCRVNKINLERVTLNNVHEN